MNSSKRFPICKALLMLPIIPLCASIVLLSTGGGDAASRNARPAWTMKAEEGYLLDKNKSRVSAGNQQSAASLAGIRNGYSGTAREADQEEQALLGRWRPGSGEAWYRVSTTAPSGCRATTQVSAD